GMTVVLISGGLTFIVGILILRPFSMAPGSEQATAGQADDTHFRELLRQLRDLDDDLATGKLAQTDHVRLRGPVERTAAAVLSSRVSGPAAGTTAAAPSWSSRSSAPGPAVAVGARAQTAAPRPPLALPPLAP